MVNYSSKKKLSSNDIYNIVKSKYIYKTLNAYIKARDIKTSKRLLDNLLILNCNSAYNSILQSRYDIHTTLYFILIKYLSTSVLFNFSSINIILKYIITNNLTIPRLDLYIEGCNQIVNIFDTLIKCIINNCYSSTKVITNCNIKFIEHSIDYIFINAKNNINCNYNYYLGVILPIIETRNIYLEQKTINRLVYIILYYKKHFMMSRYTTHKLQVTYKHSKLNNTNPSHTFSKLPNLPISKKYIVSKLYNLVSRHIINKYTVELINKNSLTYDKDCGCPSSRISPRLITIKSNVDTTLNVLTDTVYNELNKIKQLLYSKSKNSWCNIYFKNFINYYTIRICDYTVSSTIIIDGRNYLYNTKKSDKYHKLNLNLLDKYITSTPTQYNNTFIVFNIKHKDIICNYLASYLLNKDFKFNVKPLLTNSRYDNYIRIHTNPSNPSNPSNSSNPSNTIYILFTPLGVDDDLMTIYLKLSIPNAYLQTNDNYGKYFESIKSTNDYLYNLWLHINKINKSQYYQSLKINLSVY